MQHGMIDCCLLNHYFGKNIFVKKSYASFLPTKSCQTFGNLNTNIYKKSKSIAHTRLIIGYPVSYFPDCNQILYAYTDFCMPPPPEI